jgi:hypothetical protein
MSNHDEAVLASPAPVQEAPNEHNTGGPAPGPVAVDPVRAKLRAPAGGRLRWVVALLATSLVLAGAVGLAAVAGGGNSTSPTLAYVPADALAYAEARLDLPGNQREEATRFLARLPGLLDSTSLPLKIGRALDGMMGSVAGGRLSYTRDLEPWFAGPAAVALLPPPTSTDETSAAGTTRPRPAVLIAVKDRPQAEAFLEKLRAEASAQGATVTPVAVGGADGWTIARKDGPGVTVALTEDMLVASERPEDLALLMDTKAGRVPGLAGSEAFRAATAGAPADRIGSAFVRAELMGDLLAASASGGAAAGLPAGLLTAAKLPDWVFATLRAEGDRLVIDGRSAAVAGSTPAPVRPSEIVGGVPSNAIAYAESHEAGKLIGELVRALRSSPETASQLQQFDQLEPLLGVSLDAFFDFVNDAALVVLPPAAGSDAPQVGLVASLTDESVAAARLTRLRALLALGGDRVGARVTTESYGLATVVTVTFTQPSDGAGASGLPFDSISWALDRGRVVVGLTPEFVKTILDTPAGEGLGDDPAFQAKLARAGGPATAGLAYIDLRGLLGLADGAAGSIPGDMAGRMAAFEPYLDVLDSIVAVRGRDGDTPTIRIVLTTRPTAPEAPPEPRSPAP